MRKIAAFLFFLNPILWASYFAVSKEALDRFDPAVFATLDMLVAVPIGLAILVILHRRVDRQAVVAGMVLGTFHAVETLLEMHALDATTATTAGLVSNLQGVFAIFIAYVFLRRRIGGPSWLAGFLSLVGVAVLLIESPKSGGHWTGDTLAILAMFVFVIHIFMIDRFTADPAVSVVAMLGVEQLTAAAVTIGFSSFAADWQSFTTPAWSDVLIILYIALFTGVLPSAIALTCQPYVSPIYVVFVYLMEPFWLALIAFLYIGEILTPLGYLGGGLIILGSLINTVFDKSESSRQAEAAKAEG